MKDAEIRLPKERKRLATRQFGMADQLAFAALSGDYNPMHVDALAARRTQAGAPVVHGMHALLWALDALAAAELIGPQLCEIRAQFRKFTYLDVACDLDLTHWDADAARAELCSNGLVLTTIQLRNGQRLVRAEADSAELAAPEASPRRQRCRARPHCKTSQACAAGPRLLVRPAISSQRSRGWLASSERSACARLRRCRAWSEWCVPACTRSLLASPSISSSANSPRPGVGFDVSKINQQFRLIGMNVYGGGLSGTATAFMRWPPVEAPSMEAVSATVAADTFAGAVALVIGGSRGLGAVTAKAIAAGGGKVIITYAKGRDDAAKLAAEINAAYGPGVCTRARV